MKNQDPQKPINSKTKATAKSTDVRAKQFVEQLQTYISATELKKYHRYFKFDESDKSDTFIGVRMGQVFALAKEFIDMPLFEIEKLLESPIHEIRVGGVSIMDFQARNKKTSQARKQELYDLDRPRKILYKLARSKDTWERRTAIVSTLYFIGKSDVAAAFKIAEILVNDDQDLIHKGTGWALRFAGDKERKRLTQFLDKYAATMPRVTLRYAIEHFEKKQRDGYLNKKKESS